MMDLLRRLRLGFLSSVEDEIWKCGATAATKKEAYEIIRMYRTVRKAFPREKDREDMDSTLFYIVGQP